MAQALKLLILARFGVHAHCRGTVRCACGSHCYALGVGCNESHRNCEAICCSACTPAFCACLHLGLPQLWVADEQPLCFHTPPPLQLLSSPEVQQLAARTHSVLSFAAGALAPGAATVLLEPREPYVQVVALLLLGWVLLGWLAPTLLLLPPPVTATVEPVPLASTAALASAQPSGSGSSGRSQPAPSGSSQPCAGRGTEAAAKPVNSLLAAASAAAERAATMLEARLRALSWTHQRQQQLLSEPALPVPVAWLGTVSCAWICCCAVAQLYSTPT